MTIIAGVAVGGETYVGADSGSGSTHELHAARKSKVFRVGQFLVGVAGSWRVSDALSACWEPPEWPTPAPSAANLTPYEGEDPSAFEDRQAFARKQLEREVKRIEARNEPFRFLVAAVVPTIREALSEAGCLKKENEVVSMDDASLLVGFRGELFVIQGDFSVVQRDGPLGAVGSGWMAALGALVGMLISGSRASPREKVLVSLQTAAELNPFCRPPFRIFRQDEKGSVTEL